jgi:hypothetical protein
MVMVKRKKNGSPEPYFETKTPKPTDVKEVSTSNRYNIAGSSDIFRRREPYTSRQEPEKTGTDLYPVEPQEGTATKRDQCPSFNSPMKSSKSRLMISISSSKTHRANYRRKKTQPRYMPQLYL